MIIKTNKLVQLLERAIESLEDIRKLEHLQDIKKMERIRADLMAFKGTLKPNRTLELRHNPPRE